MSVIPEDIDIDALLRDASKITGFKAPRPPKNWWTPERVDQAVNHLQQNAGLSPIGAKGLVSRWAGVEASGGPSAVNPTSGAFGIGQWLGPRKNGVPPDFEGQLNHAVKELNTTESAAAKRLRAAQTAEDAAIGASMFERAEGYDPKTGRDNFVEPTIRTMGQYGTSVGPPPDYSDLLNQASAVTGFGQPETPDYTDLLNQAAAVTGDQKGTPTSPTVASPQTLNPAILAPVAEPPVPESPATLKAQMDALNNDKAPRGAVLVTPGEVIPQDFDPHKVGLFVTPKGQWLINLQAAKKLGLKDKDHIQSYLEKNHDAALKAFGVQSETVGDTSTGTAVTTTAPDGTELNSAIVTTPAAAKKQIRLDKQNHPNGTSQIVPAQAVVAKRQESVPTDLSEVPAPEYDLNDPEQKAAFDALDPNKHFATDSGTITDVPEEKPSNPTTPTAREDAGGTVAESIAFPKEIKTAAQADKYVRDEIQRKYGVELPARFTFLGSGWHPGKVTDITYDDLKAAGVDTDALISDKIAKNRVENPQPDLRRLPYDFATQDAASLQKSLENIESPENAAGDAGIVGGLAAGLGRNAGTLGGVLSWINDLSPTKGESIPESLGKQVRSVGTDVIDEMRNFYEGTQDFADKTGVKGKDGKDTFTTELVKIGAGLPGDLPRLALLSTLPGGMVSAMAIDSAAVARLKGASKEEQFKQLIKGGLMGAAFGLAKPVAGAFEKGAGTALNTSVSPIVKAGVELGTVSGGTYTVGKAFGDPDEDALRSSLINAIFHLQGMTHAMEGKTVRLRDESGKAIAGKLESDGKVVTVDADKPADIETLAPQNRAERRASAAVPETAPEPETQYTSQLDEIRQKGADTKAKIKEIFPQLSNEEAADLRRQAFPEGTKEPETVKVDEPPKPENLNTSDESVKEAEKSEPVKASDEPTSKTGELPEQGEQREPVKASDLSKIYHGTTLEAVKEIERNGFDVSKSADGTIWFTSDKSKIESGEVSASGEGGIIERQLDESKLKLGGWDEADKYSTDELIARGYDGLKLPDGANGEVTYQIFHPEKLGKAIEPVEVSAPDVTAPEKTETAPTEKPLSPAEKSRQDYGATNKIVTPDRAQKARELLAKKLNGTQLNVGLDPELLKAALDVAAFHVEAGARKFADFSKKMVEDIGEAIKPHLQDLYERVRKEHGFSGMDAPEPKAESKPEKVSSTKNRIVDKEREARGLPPVMPVIKRDFGTVFDDAMAAIDRNPQIQDELIAELKNKPRAVTDIENALLLHRQVDLQNQYDQTADRLNEAVDSGNTADVAEQRIRLAKLSDDLLDIYNAGKSAGTETGRGLNARKMMLKEDFTLASLERQKRAANGGRPLTDKEFANLQKIADEYKTKVESLEQIVKDREDRIAQMQTEATLRDIKNTSIPANILKVAENFVNKLEARGDAARKRLEKRGNVFTAGLDPVALKDLAEIGAAHIGRIGLDFAKFSEKMIAEFGEKIEPHLKKIFDASNALINNLTTDKRVRDTAKKTNTIESTVDKIAERVKEGDDYGGLVQQIARRFVEKGVTDRDKLIDAVHNVLKTADPKLTRRQTMDLISGYGDYKQLSKDAISVKLRDLKGQMQQIGKLEDMAQGKAPAKTGMERRAVTDEERRLIQQVESKKKEGGYSVTDPETQLKTALAATKTRLENSIRDLEKEIATRTRIVSKRPDSPTSPEVEKLKTKRDELKAQHQEIFGKPGMSDAQRVKLATQSLEKSIADLTKRIAAKDIRPKDVVRKTPETPELLRLRQQQKALQAQMDALRKADLEYQLNVHLAAAKTRLQNQITDLEKQIQTKERIVKNPSVLKYDAEAETLKARRDELKKQFEEVFGKREMTDEQRLKAWKTRTAKRITELQERIENEDYSKKIMRPPVPLDKDATELKVQIENLKRDFRMALEKDRLKNRTLYEKGADFAAKWSRMAVLSSPGSIAKLASAALERFVSVLPEQAVSVGISKLVPKLGEKAGMEAVPGIKTLARSEAKAFTGFFVQGMKDSWKILRSGASDLDVVYGGEHMPREWIEFAGVMHGALKAPAKRAGFERALEIGTAKLIKAGVDVSDPLVQTQLALDAYRYANRQIFMQDNIVVRAYKSAIRTLEAKQADGHPHQIGKALSTALNVLLPVVKIPTNIAIETGNYAAGSVLGTGRLLMAMRKGLENMEPEHAESIMRQMKKGSIGAVGIAIGFLNPGSVGGYYQPGKRDEKDVGFGKLRIFGVDVPAYLIHNPLLETIQIGATIRRVMDSKAKASDLGPQGLTAGMASAAFGLLEEVPFVKETAEIAKLLEPGKQWEFLDELATSRLIPQVVQFAAKRTDTDKPGIKGVLTGETIKRDPEGLIEHLKEALPLLRQSVPTKAATLEKRGTTPEEWVSSDNFKRASVEKVAKQITEEKAGGKDSTLLEDALRKKAETAIERGKFSAKMADRVNAILGLEGDDAYKPANANGKPDDDVEDDTVFNSETSFLTRLSVLAEAFKTDPANAFKKWWANETILRTENGAIIVKRMDLASSEAIKRKRMAGKEMRLDHSLPIELGGGNEEENLKLVPTEVWESYTPVENALGKALKENKITESEARRMILDFKLGWIGTPQISAALGIPEDQLKPKGSSSPKRGMSMKRPSLKMPSLR